MGIQKGARARMNAVRALRVFAVLVAIAGVAPLRSASAQTTRILVVAGVPGDAEQKKDAVPDANIVYLADKQATKAAVEKTVAEFASASKPNDTVVVLLIG